MGSLSTLLKKILAVTNQIPATFEAWDKQIQELVRSGAGFVELHRAKANIIHTSRSPSLCMLCDTNPHEHKRTIAGSHVVSNAILGEISQQFSVGGRILNRKNLTYRLFCRNAGCEEMLSDKGEGPFVEKFMRGLVSTLRDTLLGSHSFPIELEYGSWLRHCVASLCYRLMLTDLNNPRSWDNVEISDLGWGLFESLRDYVRDDAQSARFNVTLYFNSDVVRDFENRVDNLAHKIFGWDNNGKAEPVIVYGIKGAIFVVSLNDKFTKDVQQKDIFSHQVQKNGKISLSDTDILKMPGELRPVIASFCAQVIETDIIPYAGTPSSSKSAVYVDTDGECTYTMPDFTLFPSTIIESADTGFFLYPPVVSPDSTAYLSGETPDRAHYIFQMRHTVLLPRTIEYDRDAEAISFNPHKFTVFKSIEDANKNKAWLLQDNYPKDGFNFTLVLLVRGDIRTCIFAYDLKVEGGDPKSLTEKLKLVWKGTLSEEAFLGDLSVKPADGTDHDGKLIFHSQMTEQRLICLMLGNLILTTE